MSSEDQDILAKISQLAGKINRAKNGQSGDQQTQFAPPPRAQTFDGYPAYRGRGGYASRAFSGGRGSVHRNRTLVLNGNATLSPSDGPLTTAGDKNTSPAGNSEWISKTNRGHKQLINTAIYEQDTQRRLKATEVTRQLKLKQKDEREKNRFAKHLHRTSRGAYSGQVSNTSVDTNSYEVIVNGIKFRVAKGGSKLVKLHDDGIAAKNTPKTAIVGGVKFIRSVSGNMYRYGIVKAHRSTGVIKKLDEPCKQFSTTGSCHKGPRCRYIHDPSKVALCKDLLLKGACPSGDSCDLSHDKTAENIPYCLHFAKGNCSNPKCSYLHVRVSQSAPVCRAFGFYGYCQKGTDCTERHVHECPDFSNTGVCKTRGCKLPHREKASVMRNNPARSSNSPEEESDISSDEEEIGDDDVDSDDLEEFFDDDTPMDTDIPTQQNFVQFS